MNSSGLEDGEAAKMVAITLPEMRPGLISFLDDNALIASELCSSNVIEADRVAQGLRPFMTLERYEDADWLCIPLFTHDLDGSKIKLVRKLKQGPGKGWVGRDSFYHPLQFWRIPELQFIAASVNERSAIGNRQAYALNWPTALCEIIAHVDDSPLDFERLMKQFHPNAGTQDAVS